MPGSPGAKLLIASIALCAYRNRHQGTLMHCCEAWELVGKRFDQYSFECIGFHELSQIIANLTRGRIAEREVETHGPSLDENGRLGAPRNRCSASTQLPMKTVTLSRTRTNQACCYAYTGIRFLRPVSRWRHHCHETILGHVQKAPDDIRWEIDRHEFDEMMASKKVSAPGPDGIPYSIYKCAGGLGSQFLFNVCKRVLEGGARCSRTLRGQQDRFHFQIVRG